MSVETRVLLVEASASSMEQSDCPFCHRSFAALGRHLKFCRLRDGRDYSGHLAPAAGGEKTAVSVWQPSLSWEGGGV